MYVIFWVTVLRAVERMTEWPFKGLDDVVHSTELGSNQYQTSPFATVCSSGSS